MIQLKKIISVEYQRTCFCGRPLIRSICEIHGSDIKVSHKIINAQFLISDERIEEKAINISLTENQFYNLFSKRDLTQISDTQLRYRIKLSSYGNERNPENIIEEFFEYLEYDLFFNKKRINEISVTSSGIIISYLIDYQITTEKEILVFFEILASRNLREYIDWRIKHLQGKRGNIIKSLQTTRKEVYSIEGEPFFIEDLIWNEKKIMPEKIIVKRNEEDSATIELLPKNLFQTHKDFFLSSRIENRMVNALKQFSQKFNTSFKQFLQQNSILAEIEKSKDEENNNSYELLIGKILPINYETFQRKIDENKSS